MTHGANRGTASVSAPAGLLGAVPGPDRATAGEVLSAYLHEQSTAFLRALRLHRESGSDARSSGEAARELRAAARRISGALHTFRPLTDECWADQLRSELGWLSGTLAREHSYADRLERLLAALHRVAGPAEPAGGTRAPENGTPAPRTPSRAAAAGDPGPRTGRGREERTRDPKDPAATTAAGAARAGALLDRQLTLARTRAHSAALQALGSSRFHAVADAVAVLASEAPLDKNAADRPATEALPPLAEQAHRRLAEAVAALPLSRAGHPYNAAALAADDRHDAPWHQVRLLLRHSRYAQEVADGGVTDLRLVEAGRALERHRDAAEAAAAASAAARTPRIAPATAYALGVLHADQRHEVEAARYAFTRAWRTVCPTER
ncbi:metal-binding protein [Streptomyces sp. Ru73]|uniref:CHAD domain-containing protein n=1 Tax=Streptomyces sp. Ru73 TaxID=2080748 RepID=UPI000CDDD3D0|nr:CHAD domain-containing protein [Streptomyces sp. Ru73]POX41309.1 metal-binding protein [Streptomyces sp. Ru73]